MRIREEKKTPTPAERAKMALLEEEGDRILGQLRNNPTNRELIDRLNQVDVAYVRLSGEKTMEY